MVGEGGCWAMASDLGLEILGLTVSQRGSERGGGAYRDFLVKRFVFPKVCINVVDSSLDQILAIE